MRLFIVFPASAIGRSRAEFIDEIVHGAAILPYCSPCAYLYSAGRDLVGRDGREFHAIVIEAPSLKPPQILMFFTSDGIPLPYRYSPVSTVRFCVVFEIPLCDMSADHYHTATAVSWVA